MRERRYKAATRILDKLSKKTGILEMRYFRAKDDQRDCYLLSFPS